MSSAFSPTPSATDQAWPTCASCGAPVTSDCQRAAADVRTLSNIRNAHCMYCTNLAVCGACCEACGAVPGGANCEMEW